MEPGGEEACAAPMPAAAEVRHVENYHCVPVAAEFLLPGHRPVPVGEEQPKDKKGWRKRTQAMAAQGATERPKLCNHVNRGAACPFQDKCKFSHDVEAYLATRGPDIAAVCPVLQATGSCAMGYSCRFVGAHLYANAFGEPPVRNTNAELLNALQRKTYEFKGVHERDDEPATPIDLTGMVYVAPLTTVGNLCVFFSRERSLHVFFNFASRAARV